MTTLVVDGLSGRQKRRRIDSQSIREARELKERFKKLEARVLADLGGSFGR